MRKKGEILLSFINKDSKLMINTPKDVRVKPFGVVCQNKILVIKMKKDYILDAITKKLLKYKSENKYL